MLNIKFKRKTPERTLESVKADRAISAMYLKRCSKKRNVYLSEEGKKVLDRWIYDI